MAPVSLRSLPASERRLAAFVVLALGAFLAGGLAFLAGRGKATGTPPAGKSRLIAVLEGVMAPNASPAEVEAFRAWVGAGATREAYAPVEAVVANNCAACHGPGGQFPRLTTFEELRPLALEPAGGGLFDLLGERTLHLVLFPLVFLVAGFGYLRRAAWRGRRVLLALCAGAVLADMAAWSLLPGQAGAALAARALLGAAYLALAIVVLADLRGGRAR